MLPTAPVAPSTSTVSPGCEPGAPRDREPAREARVAERRRDGVVDALGDVEQRVVGDERALGHRAVGRDGAVEVDAPAVREAAHAVGADHGRQRRRAGVEGARRLVEVEVMQRGGGDVDHRGAGGLAGVVELAERRRGSMLVQDGGAHPAQSRSSRARAQRPLSPDPPIPAAPRRRCRSPVPIGRDPGGSPHGCAADRPWLGQRPTRHPRNIGGSGLSGRRCGTRRRPCARAAPRARACSR